MCSEKCNTLLTGPVENIISIFRQQHTKAKEEATSCFIQCYQPVFIHWAIIRYKGYNTELVEFNASSAFTDSVLKLSTDAQAGKLYTDKATTKTIFFNYYYNFLRRYLQDENRLQEKKEKFRKETEVNEANTANDDLKEKRLLQLEACLNKMNEKDRQIIIWRHIERKSCDEIAQLLAINKKSATNSIYRCLVQLKNMIENEK